MRAPALPRTSLGTVVLTFICMSMKESVEIAPVPYTLQVHGVALDGRDPSNPLRREKKQVHCQLGQYLHPRETHCCMRCHAGTYKAKDCDRPDQAPVCLPCANGTFTAVDNTMSKCFQCTRCRAELQQIVESPCTPKQDTICGCRKNQYQLDAESDLFQCRNCSSCANGIIANYYGNSFFFSLQVQRTGTQFAGVNLYSSCHIIIFASLATGGTLVLGIFVAIFGVISILCVANKVGKLVRENRIMSVSSICSCDPAILYTVVDHVPPSRWKEFVRRLGLSDYDLERIELEHRRLRDAQYEMLRLWKLQMGRAATVEHISCVLNQMELSGCSDAIQEALLNQNSPQPCSLHSHL
ncbi:TNF receptor superfamily member 1A [Willisornis vidua]|uniref:TNF receptor superfamily member 1A n=1 Tax=Willisornis vidua TaxID=1566151 RepID=A0ABQ9CNL5_9PASS|nr:TNF receptor superfamily member 1A [Willisornis vidua]